MRTNPPILPESLAQFFTPDRLGEERSQIYPCRPLVAHSLERRTVFSSFIGEIGLADCKRFKAALQDLCTEQVSKIIVDFSGLSLTRSAAGDLVAFAAFTHGMSKRLYLYAISPQIRALLKKLGLTPFFNYLEKEEDIIATLVV